MGFRIDGVQDLIDDLNIMLSMRDTNALLKKGAQPLLEQMKQNASTNPKVVSGKLRAALSVEGRSGNTVTIGVHRKNWDDGAYYPAYVEYGHAGPHPAPAHPFIRPAIDAKAGESMDRITQLLRQALGK